MLNIFFLGLVSFFTDISSEMVYPIIPLYLTSAFGATPALVGVIEGFAESLASLLKVFSGYVSDRYREAAESLPTLPGESERDAKLRKIHGLCFMFFMPNLQERAAKMLGACGINVLTPYSDYRLAQYLYNVPWSMKSLRGQEKGLFRAAMEGGVIPDSLLWRKKSPYPKTYHPGYTRLTTEALANVLSDPASPILQLVDRDALIKLMSGPLTSAPWFGQLMAGPQMLAYLLQVNQWMLKYRVEVGL